MYRYSGEGESTSRHLRHVRIEDIVLKLELLNDSLQVLGFKLREDTADERLLLFEGLATQNLQGCFFLTFVLDGHFLVGSRFDDTDFSSGAFLLCQLACQVRTHFVLGLDTHSPLGPRQLVVAERQIAGVRDGGAVRAGHQARRHILQVVAEFFRVVKQPVAVLSVQKVLLFEVRPG